MQVHARNDRTDNLKNRAVLVGVSKLCREVSACGVSADSCRARISLTIVNEPLKAQFQRML